MAVAPRPRETWDCEERRLPSARSADRAARNRGSRRASKWLRLAEMSSRQTARRALRRDMPRRAREARDAAAPTPALRRSRFVAGATDRTRAGLDRRVECSPDIVEQ